MLCRLLKKGTCQAECYVGLGPPIAMKVPPPVIPSGARNLLSSGLHCKSRSLSATALEALERSAHAGSDDMVGAFFTAR